MVLHDSMICDQWAKMHDVIVSFNIAKRDWKGLVAVGPEETAMQIGAVGSYGQNYHHNGGSKGKGKGKGQDRQKMLDMCTRR